MKTLLLAATAFGALAATPALADDPIVIGVPVGLSGANSVVAPSVVQAAELAVDEINAAGGVLGRPLALEVADDASGAAGAQKAFDALLFQKEVDVLISMETSAARNAGLPIVKRAEKPYIYTSFYEGRSCSPYMYVNAWVPEQQVPPIVDKFMADGAKKFFLIGSDYAFGRGMLEFTRAYVEGKGGTVVGEEYLPMDGTDWTPILSALKASGADALVTSTAGGAPNVTLTKQLRGAGGVLGRPLALEVADDASGADALVTSTAGGAPNVTLTKQLRGAGIDLPYGNLAVDEGTAKSMGADATGIYISASYVTSIDSPANAKFKEALAAKFGDAMLTPNDLSVPQYEAVYAYKAAVEKAGSTDTDAVLDALGEVAVEGPRGTITMNKQHHAPLTMYLGQVQADGSVAVIEAFDGVDPGTQCPDLAD